MTRKHKRHLHKIDDAFSVAQYAAQETKRSWFVLGSDVGQNPMFVVDERGRKGYEQFKALEVKADGELAFHEAAPRI